MQPADEARNGATAYRSGLELYPPGGPASALVSELPLDFPGRWVRLSMAASSSSRKETACHEAATGCGPPVDGGHPALLPRCPGGVLFRRYLVFVLSASVRSRFPLVSETKGNLTAPMIDGVSNPTRPTMSYQGISGLFGTSPPKTGSEKIGKTFQAVSGKIVISGSPAVLPMNRQR